MIAQDTLAHVTIGVVSYNVAPLLADCLESAFAALDEVRADLGATGQVVVVDNASRDESVALVGGRFLQARLVQNPDNRGFGAGCNQALAQAEAGGAVLFLNPDARLLPGALTTLLCCLREHEGRAVVGPRLEYPDGAAQPTRRRFPTPLVLALESTPLEWRGVRLRALRRYRFEDEPDVSGAVDWLSGACLLGRVDALRSVGGFDPHFFMYFEEVDLARRLAANGWQTWYEPAARVIHAHSRSADQNLGAKDRNYYRSKYRYAKRYFGATLARALRFGGAAAFGAEALVQRARGDKVLSQRWGSLARWHLMGGA